MCAGGVWRHGVCGDSVPGRLSGMARFAGGQWQKREACADFVPIFEVRAAGDRGMEATGWNGK